MAHLELCAGNRLLCRCQLVCDALRLRFRLHVRILRLRGVVQGRVTESRRECRVICVALATSVLCVYYAGWQH